MIDLSEPINLTPQSKIRSCPKFGNHLPISRNDSTQPNSKSMQKTQYTYDRVSSQTKLVFIFVFPDSDSRSDDPSPQGPRSASLRNDRLFLFPRLLQSSAAIIFIRLYCFRLPRTTRVIVPMQSKVSAPSLALLVDHPLTSNRSSLIRPFPRVPPDLAPYKAITPFRTRLPTCETPLLSMPLYFFKRCGAHRNIGDPA